MKQSYPGNTDTLVVSAQREKHKGENPPRPPADSQVSVNKMTSKVQSEKNLSLKAVWQTACNDLNSL